MQQPIIIDDEIVLQKMLNGVPVEDFIAFYLWAFIAMLVVFGIGVQSNARRTGWDWLKFWRGWKRILVNMLLIAAGVVFWPNISSFIFQSDTPVELTMWSAFMLGLGLDRFRGWVKNINVKK